MKALVRTAAKRLGYGVFDLRKDQWPGVFLPSHLAHTLAALQINCVIDVGANFGQYALMLRAAGYRGRIVSLEPVPETYEVLSRTASTDPAWATLNLALGDRETVETLNVFAGSDLSSFLSPTGDLIENVAGAAVIRAQPVAMKRLDSLFGELVAPIHAPRVFLKLDTQGYDLRVLQGASASIGSVHGIQTEVSVIPLYDGAPDYLDVLGVCRQWGFEPTAFVPVSYDRKTGHVLEFDVVLRRRVPPVTP